MLRMGDNSITKNKKSKNIHKNIWWNKVNKNKKDRSVKKDNPKNTQSEPENAEKKFEKKNKKYFDGKSSESVKCVEKTRRIDGVELKGKSVLSKQALKRKRKRQEAKSKRLEKRPQTANKKETFEKDVRRKSKKIKKVRRFLKEKGINKRNDDENEMTFHDAVGSKIDKIENNAKGKNYCEVEGITKMKNKTKRNIDGKSEEVKYIEKNEGLELRAKSAMSMQALKKKRKRNECEAEEQAERKNQAKKRKVDDKSHRNQKEEEGKTDIKAGDTSGDLLHNIEVDTNWKSLMKSTKYQLQEKKGIGGSTISGIKAKIWFDDVDPELLEDTEVQTPSKSKQKNKKVDSENKGNPLLLKKKMEIGGLTKYVGLDCEMVGIGPAGKESMLGRISIINQHGVCLYDKFVAPQDTVTNYRTDVSGIQAKDLANGEDFSTVQKEVASILKGRILVGHALHHDLKVLYLTHPKMMIRDTSKYKPFRTLFEGRIPSLQKLSQLVLKVPIQEAAHNSVEDAQAAMKLFMLHRQKWEKEISNNRSIKLKVKTRREAKALPVP